MPLIGQSSYTAKGVFRNTHINTVFPSLFRKVPLIYDRRERIKTPDDDFFDIDWIERGNEKVIVALHGLEGCSENHYMVWMLKYFAERRWDAVGMNFRSCSGEMNRQLRSYNMGETMDVRYLLRYLIEEKKYRQIAIVGFSLGGSVCLNLLGRDVVQLPDQVVGGAAFSVPCDIPTANIEINKWQNFIYLQRFLVSLNEKARIKSEQFPEVFGSQLKKPRNFDAFDEAYTAPAHGFKSAMDYWTMSSSLQHLPQLDRPTLLVNALDDSFLSKECFPIDLAKGHQYLHLEIPEHGGHIGFVGHNKQGHYWPEKRAFEFLNKLI
ncbi:MAG: alpha/beta fold hydrolase [Saprospiraceae bacterium]|nr:alpha/beta fold hydrolase [Saprospiraceae bacterium]